MNFKGFITHIGDVKSGTAKNGAEWKSLEFVVGENGVMYPQSAVFKFMKSGEHVKHVDNFTTHHKVGEQVDVEFNLKCNKWKDSYFQELSVWKINKLSASKGVKDKSVEEVSQFEDDGTLPF